MFNSLCSVFPKYPNQDLFFNFNSVNSDNYNVVVVVVVAGGCDAELLLLHALFFPQLATQFFLRNVVFVSVVVLKFKQFAVLQRIFVGDFALFKRIFVVAHALLCERVSLCLRRCQRLFVCLHGCWTRRRLWRVDRNKAFLFFDRSFAVCNARRSVDFAQIAANFFQALRQRGKRQQLQVVDFFCAKLHVIRASNSNKTSEQS